MNTPEEMEGWIKKRMDERGDSLTKEGAVKVLLKPNIFEDITKNYLDQFIVEEIKTRKTVFLCSCGSYVLNAHKTSYNLMVTGMSGTGKDFVTSQTLENCWNGEKFIKRTRISEKVLNYWHNPKFEPDWTWDGKVLYLVDISNTILNSDVFKVMVSDGSHATVLINQFPVDIEIKGKPVTIVTTAAATPNAELMRRFPAVTLDETVEQTTAIMERQAKIAAGEFEIKTEVDYRFVLSFLSKVDVEIPFAVLLPKFFMNSAIIARTHFQRFLDLIKASAALHQYQRNKVLKGSKIVVFADEQDYVIAREVFECITRNKRMVPLSATQSNVLTAFVKHGDGAFNLKEIEIFVPFISSRYLRDVLDDLVAKGFLVKDRIIDEETNKTVISYRVAVEERICLPDFKDLAVSLVKSVECVVSEVDMGGVEEKLCR